MRIVSFSMQAFGPFTDKTLSFPAEGPPGLHIVYGENEAGKSSTMRALKAWLFGFPERTADNFLHPSDQLLVSGILQNEAGERLLFSRRKKRKVDLFDADGNPLDATVLAAFLPVGDQIEFESLYGLGHEELIRGGAEILAQKGEVGQALFSAGTGITGLRAVLDGIEAEADGLYRARGSTRTINLALSRYQEIKKTVRDAVLPGRRWQELNRELEATAAAISDLDCTLAQKDRQRRQLERLLQLSPLLARRAELIRQLGGEAGAEVLPADFAERRQRVERELHALKHRRVEVEGRLRDLGEGSRLTEAVRMILALDETIEQIHQRLGEFLKAEQDRPRLEGLRIAQRKEAGEALRALRPDLSLDQVEGLRPLMGRRQSILRLANRHDGLEQRLAELGARLDRLDQALAELGAELAGLPEEEGPELATAVNVARAAGELDAICIEKSRVFERKNEELTASFARLGLWQGDLAGLLSLALPQLETIRRYEGLIAACEEERRNQARDRDRLSKRLLELNDTIARLAGAGAVPTEEELAGARQVRDADWKRIRKQWLAGEAGNKEALPHREDRFLAKAADDYEKRVERADELSDRLRWEAERVQRFAALTAEQSSTAAALEAVQRSMIDWNQKRQSLEEEWRSHWQAFAFVPLPPREMLTWATEVEALRQKAEDVRNLDRELAGLFEERRRLIALLSEAMALPCRADDPEELAPLLRRAEDLLAARQKRDERRNRLGEKMLSLKEEQRVGLLERDRLERERADWSRLWSEAVAELGGGREILPVEVADLLELLQRCFDSLKEADLTERRIEGIDRDAEDFKRSVAALTTALAPELTGLDPRQAVARLKAMLNEAREGRTLFLKDRDEKSRREEELAAIEQKERELGRELAELCRLAGCDDSTGLSEAERRSGLSARLLETEAMLAEGAGGLSLAELEAELGRTDPDSIPGSVAQLGREMEQELTPALRALAERRGEIKRQLAQMDGVSLAADAAEEAARELAGIRRLANRYTVLRLASAVLRREIERFRAENQGPILLGASRFFQELTLGSFTGLRTDENDQGEPVLVGLRGDSIRISPERMSSGTRDQLYLALRLAAIEWRLAEHEPMPFIVDDILVNCDDQRTRAALRILAGLAGQSQIIIFTHHRRLLDEARLLSETLPVEVHAL